MFSIYCFLFHSVLKIFTSTHLNDFMTTNGCVPQFGKHFIMKVFALQGQKQS
jgi:hypothetical protein